MKYMKVRWDHSSDDEPVLLLYELMEDRYTARVIEVFADGRMGFASSEFAIGGTILAEKPIPTPSEIATDPQFSVDDLAAQEFENLWMEATRVSDE